MNQTTESSLPRRVELLPLFHRGQKQIAIHFPFDPEIKDLIKSFEGATWTQTHSCFYIAKSQENIASFLRHIKGKGIWVDQTRLYTTETRDKAQKTSVNQESRKNPQQQFLSADNIQRLETFKAWMEQKRYSASTIHIYLNHLKQFFLLVESKPYNEITVEDVTSFNHKVIIGGKLSPSY